MRYALIFTALTILVILLICLLVYFSLKSYRNKSTRTIINKSHIDATFYREFIPLHPSDPVIRYNHYEPEQWIITVKFGPNKTSEIQVSKASWSQLKIGDQYPKLIQDPRF